PPRGAGEATQRCRRRALCRSARAISCAGHGRRSADDGDRECLFHAAWSDLRDRWRRRMTGINRTGNTAIAALASVLAAGGVAMAGSLGGPLELADEGSFFVNGTTAGSSHPGASVLGPSPSGTI